MKIAILSMYSGHSNRGVETWAHQMGNELGKRHEVVIYQGEKAMFKHTNYTVVHSHVDVNWKKPDSRGTFLRNFFLDYWSLLVLKFTVSCLPNIGKTDYDIIIPTNGGWQALLIRLYCLFSKATYVAVGHSGAGWDEAFNLFTFPTVFVCLSPKAVSWSRKIQPFTKRVYIPNGVDLQVFKPSGKKATLNLEKPVILAVGALEGGKRLDLAIKAVSKMQKGSLLIVGDGAEKDGLRTLASSLPANRFSICTASYEQMPEYYRAADVFTLPSWKHEAFGIVYLEAMATNLPVVATNDAIRRSIIGEAGILVDPEDSDDYSHALTKASRMNWGDNPRKQAEKFSWQAVGRQYEELFLSLKKNE